MNLLFVTVALATLALRQQVAGHARVMNPPQRGSLWRFPEYTWANPGHSDDDAFLTCGGSPVTDPNNGACGPCGDSVLEPTPRKHEIGGEYERGIIVGNYTVGQSIRVYLEIVAGHRPGFMEFKLCPYSVTRSETQACFDQYPLLFANGASRVTLEEVFAADGWMELRLPPLLRCDRCVLQWYWLAEGNRQHYRNCIDIGIH